MLTVFTCKREGYIKFFIAHDTTCTSVTPSLRRLQRAT
jgi:hypothetical protein